MTVLKSQRRTFPNMGHRVLMRRPSQPLTIIAKENGWELIEGASHTFKKNEVIISVCNHCGGGWVAVLNEKGRPEGKYVRGEAEKFLKGEKAQKYARI